MPIVRDFQEIEIHVGISTEVDGVCVEITWQGMRHVSCDTDPELVGSVLAGFFQAPQGLELLRQVQEQIKGVRDAGPK